MADIESPCRGVDGPPVAGGRVAIFGADLTRPLAPAHKALTVRARPPSRHHSRSDSSGSSSALHHVGSSSALSPPILVARRACRAAPRCSLRDRALVTNLGRDGKPTDALNTRDNYLAHRELIEVPPANDDAAAVELNQVATPVFANMSLATRRCLSDEAAARRPARRAQLGMEPPRFRQHPGDGSRNTGTPASRPSDRADPSGDRREGALYRQSRLAHPGHAGSGAAPYWRNCSRTRPNWNSSTRTTGGRAIW